MYTTPSDTICAFIDLAFREQNEKLIDFSSEFNKQQLTNFVTENAGPVLDLFPALKKPDAFNPNTYTEKLASIHTKEQIRTALDGTARNPIGKKNIKRPVQEIIDSIKDSFLEEVHESKVDITDIITEDEYPEDAKDLESKQIYEINIDPNCYQFIVLDNNEDEVQQQAEEAEEGQFNDADDETPLSSKIKNANALAAARSKQQTNADKPAKGSKGKGSKGGKAAEKPAVLATNVGEAVGSNKIQPCIIQDSPFKVNIGTVASNVELVDESELDNLCDDIIGPDNEDDSEWVSTCFGYYGDVLKQSLNPSLEGHQAKKAAPGKGKAATKAEEPLPTEEDVDNFVTSAVALNTCSEAILSELNKTVMFGYNEYEDKKKKVKYDQAFFPRKVNCTKYAFTGKGAKDLKLKYTLESKLKNEAEIKTYDKHEGWIKHTKGTLSWNYVLCSQESVNEVLKEVKAKAKEGITYKLNAENNVYCIETKPAKGNGKPSYEYYEVFNPKQLKTNPFMKLYAAYRDFCQIIESKISKIKINPLVYLQSPLVKTENIYEYTPAKDAKKLYGHILKFYQLFGLALNTRQLTVDTFTSDDNTVAADRANLGLELIKKPTVDKLSETIFQNFNGYINADNCQIVNDAFNQAVKNLQALDKQTPITEAWTNVLKSAAFRNGLSGTDQHRFNNIFNENFKQLYNNPASRQLYATTLYPISFLFTPFMVGIKNGAIQRQFLDEFKDLVKDNAKKSITGDLINKFFRVFFKRAHDLCWTRYLECDDNDLDGKTIVPGLTAFICKFVKSPDGKAVGGSKKTATVVADTNEPEPDLDDDCFADDL